jgi:hypothetical protein
MPGGWLAGSGLLANEAGLRANGIIFQRAGAGKQAEISFCSQAGTSKLANALN